MSRSQATRVANPRPFSNLALALLAERPRFGDSVKETVGGIRYWLRNHGIMRLDSMGKGEFVS